MEDAWEDVEEVRDKSGRNEAVGGRGEGKRWSLLISWYLSNSRSLNGVDGGRSVKSMGDARNADSTEAVMGRKRPAGSRCWI